MATKPLVSNPVADLPVNWVNNNIVAPNGTSVGLTQQHGYNYLMGKVNEALEDLGDVNDAFAPLLDDTDRGALKTVTGSVASFKDGSSLPFSKFICNIDPIQNLNGQSAPYPAGGGKNKAKPTLETVTQSGITYTANADGTVTCTGSSTISTVNYIKVGEVSVTNGQTYILSGCPSDGGQNSYRLDLRTGTSTIYNNAIDNGSGVTFTADADVTLDVYVRFNVSYAITGSLLFKPMVCLSTASDPDYAHYAPYSNVCPIYGHSGVNAVVAGRNMVDIEDFTLVKSTERTKSITFPTMLPAGTYTLSFNVTANTGTKNTSIAIREKGGSPYVSIAGTAVLAGATGAQSLTFTSAIPFGFMYVYMGSNDADAASITIEDIQIEVGSTSSTYEPYVGTTYPVTFYDGDNPLTVYKGTIDLVSGVLTVTGAYVNANTKTWTNSTYSGGDAVYANFTDKPRDTSALCICDTYSTATYSSSDRIVLYDGVSSAADIQTKIATGDVHILYTLATPLVYQLTPTEVLSLLGQNNCYNDCGNTAVEYESSGLASVELVVSLFKEASIFVAEEGVTTELEIEAAVNAGKTVLCRLTNGMLGTYSGSASGTPRFSVVSALTTPPGVYAVSVSGSSWSKVSYYINPRTRTVTLTAAGWSSLSQTVAVTSVTASNSLVISPAPADALDYVAAGIVCTAQGAGNLTFTCTETPSTDIDVNVLVF